MIAALGDLGLTTVLTLERTEEYGTLSRFDVEEFVVDNVIVVRNVLEAQRRRRTIEVVKFRGANHRKGEFPFSVMPDQGVVVIPLSAVRLDQPSSNVRISSGNTDLDAMCDGGYFQDSIILVSGATGTGKTLLATQFVATADGADERCLLFAFEESREQLIRNASSWGMNLTRSERDGRLRIVCAYPESEGLEDHLIRIKAEIDAFAPKRVAIDSVSALTRIAETRAFREFVFGLAAFLKSAGCAALVTATTPSLIGGDSATDAYVSTITDSIILLRYVEHDAELRRALAVLKMRGSAHDRSIREFTIGADGIRIGARLRGVTGIVTGTPAGTSDSAERA